MELKVPEIINSVTLKNSVISQLQGNIIRVKVKEYSSLDVEDIREILKAKRELINDQKHTVLFITPRYGSITKEAREFSATYEANENAVAKAIVLNGLAMRIIANFFINYDKPPIEHKAFETERDAIEWLKKISL
jgi:hypothetical protein